MGSNLDPRGLIGRISVGDHSTFLHTKYLSCGLMVSEKKTFLHYKSLETLDPQGGASLDPMDLIGRIYVGDH